MPISNLLLKTSFIKSVPNESYTEYNFHWQLAVFSASEFLRRCFLYSKFCTYGKINTVILNDLIFTDFSPCVIISCSTLKADAYSGLWKQMIYATSRKYLKKEELYLIPFTPFLPVSCNYRHVHWNWKATQNPSMEYIREKGR